MSVSVEKPGRSFVPHQASIIIENRTFDEIGLGDRATITRTLTKEDVDLFAVVSGDTNPAHLDTAYAETGLFHHVVAHGMWGGALISGLLGTKLPGPGMVYLAQNLQFLQPVSIGDTLAVTVVVREKRPERSEVVLDCSAINQQGTLVVSGSALVRAPREKIRRRSVELPEVRLARHDRFRDLLARASGQPPLPTAVVHPCDAASVKAAVDAAEAGLIAPILVGPEAKIRAAAAEAHVDIAAFRLIAAPHSHAAAATAVGLVRSGTAQLLMKGSLHTDELMHEVVGADGLRTERRISHVYLMDVPAYPRPLLITDAAINIAPTLEEKRDIVQNAIDLAHVMGIERPRVAILSATEDVNPALRSTLDAAALCKMAERGQITGGLLDGPLAFDNAVSEAAAREKGIVSAVAGVADILVVPDLEAGNMLAKQLTFLAGADAAGVVLGARVPIILTSRADAERTRIASCAVATLLARSRGVARA